MRSIRDGETTTAVVGNANAAGDPIVADTPFRIGEASWMFIAAMVMQLVEEGRVELDEPLSAYLTDTPIGGDIPIRLLLNHYSGLPDTSSRPALRADAMADRERVFTPSEVLSYIEDAPTAPPGESYVWSRANFILLAQLIEELDGTDLNTALRQRINEPLGLEVTAFDTGDTPAPDGLAAGWSPTRSVNGDPAEPYASIASITWPAVAFSTTGEIATFFSGLFGGELVSADSLAEMTDLGPEGYGLGIGGYIPSDGTQMYGHVGFIDGYTGGMVHGPTSGDTLVVLTNNEQMFGNEVGVRIVEELWLDSAATQTTAT